MNILVYAFRDDSPNHDLYREWLEEAANSPEALGVSELALSGFVRVVAHPKIFSKPTPPATALSEAESVLSAPAAVRLRPGPSHWDIFARLCRKTATKGNLVADAYHAALAIESASTFVTTDRDYARFDGLRCEFPFG